MKKYLEDYKKLTNGFGKSGLLLYQRELCHFSAGNKSQLIG